LPGPSPVAERLEEAAAAARSRAARALACRRKGPGPAPGGGVPAAACTPGRAGSRRAGRGGCRPPRSSSRRRRVLAQVLDCLRVAGESHRSGDLAVGEPVGDTCCQQGARGLGERRPAKRPRGRRRRRGARARPRPLRACSFVEWRWSARGRCRHCPFAHGAALRTGRVVPSLYGTWVFSR